MKLDGFLPKVLMDSLGHDENMPNLSQLTELPFRHFDFL